MKVEPKDTGGTHERATQGRVEAGRRAHAAGARRRGRLAQAGRGAGGRRLEQGGVRDEDAGRYGEGAGRQRLPRRARTSRSSRRRTSRRTARSCRSASPARIPKTESIAILVEKNPNMLAAVFDIPPGTEPSMSTRVKMGQSSNVVRAGQGRRQVLRRDQGNQGHARRLRRLNGKRTMADPMRIRANVVRRHHRGQGADESRDGNRPAQGCAGKVVPAWFIQNVTATWNGKTVLSAQWGPAVSKNPFLSFKFKGGAKGDKVQITWIDNRATSAPTRPSSPRLRPTMAIDMTLERSRSTRSAAPRSDPATRAWPNVARLRFNEG